MSRRESVSEGDPQLFEASVPEVLIAELQKESRLENLGSQIAPVCITASVWLFSAFCALALCIFVHGLLSSSKVISGTVPKEPSPAEYAFVPEER